MSSTEDGTWYELRPNGQPIIGSANPARYRDQAAAERAGAQMRQRYPDFRFVEIIAFESRAGEQPRTISAGRV